MIVDANRNERQSVLLVAFSTQNSDQICKNLQNIGWQVSLARSSAEALEIVSGETRLDLVLIDLQPANPAGGEHLDGARIAQMISAVRRLPVVYLAGAAGGSQPVPEAAGGSQPVPVYGIVNTGMDERTLGAALNLALGLFAAHEQAQNQIAAMQAKETQLQLAIEASQDAFFDLDIAADAISFNPVFWKLLGYDAPLDIPQSPGRTAWLPFVHPLDRPSILLALADCIDNRQDAVDQDFRMRTKGGGWRWVRSHIRVARSLPAGPPLHLIGVLTDITSQKQVEAEFHKTRKMLTATEQLGKVGAWEFSLDSLKQTWTDEVYKIHEVDASFQPTVTNGLQFYAPPSRPVIEQAVKRAIEDGEPFDVELEIITAKGNYRWVHAIGEADWKQRRVFGFFQDITPRKQAELTLQERLMLSLSSETLSLDSFLQKTLDSAELLTRSQIGFAHFLEDDQENLQLQMWSTNTINNMCTAEGKGSHYPVDQAGVWADCVRTRAPIVHNDYPNLPNRRGLPQGHAQVSREMVIPLIRQDKIVMIMGVGNKPSDYTPEDAEIVTQLADLSWDIIQRKRLEAALRDSEKRFSSAFEYAAIGMALVSPQGRFMKVNRALCRMLGYSEDEMLKFSFRDITHPDDLQTSLLLTLKLFAGEIDRFQVEKRYLSSQGRVVWALLNVALVRDDQNQPVHQIAQLQDITESKRISEALQAGNDLFKKFLYYSPIYAFIKHVTSQTSKVIYASENYREMIGVSASEMIGKSMSELFPPDFARKITEDDWKVVSDGRMISLDEELNGRSYTTIKFPITQGERTLLAGYTIDITERKRNEDLVSAAGAYNRGLIEASIDPLVVIGPDGQIKDVNRATEIATGLPRGELIGTEFSCYFTDPDQARTGYREALSLGFVIDYPLTIRHQSGATLDVLFNATVFRSPQGEVEGVFAAARDITERKEAEEKLRASEHFVRSVLDSLTAHIAVLDESGVIISVNEAWRNFARQNGSPDEHAYLGANYLAACQPAVDAGDELVLQILQNIRAVLAGNLQEFSLEYRCDSPTEQNWFTVTAVPRYDTGKGAILIHRNITDMKKSQQALESAKTALQKALAMEQRLARTDPLTGVNNRRHLFEIAQHEFEIAERYQQPLSVIMFDIDFFKRVNDNYGHQAGDETLREAARVVSAELRSADTIGRYGGEEFIVLLPMTSIDHARALAERIREKIASMTVLSARGEIQITGSIGIVECNFNLPGESVESVFRRADDAMYAAKQGGRNRVCSG